MSNLFTFEATTRTGNGTSAARKSRREGKVPAVLYGREGQSVSILLDHNEVEKHLIHEAVYSHLLELKIDGQPHSAVLKAVQRHPVKGQALHLDFLRIDKDSKIKVHVPLHFTDEHQSVGGKKGGVATHSMVDVEVSCFPMHLPEYILVDISKLDIGQTIHLSDIVLPGGVEIVALSHGADHDLPVVTMMSSRASKEDAS